MQNIDYRWESFPVIKWKQNEETADLVKKIRSSGCGIEDDEIGLLYEMAKGLHHDNKDTQGFVVELGTCTAGSGSALGLGLKASDKLRPVVTVDNYYDWQGHEKRTEQYVEARDKLYKFELANDYVCQVVTNSHNIFFNFWNSPIRIFFIDSSHHGPFVTMEITAALPHMVEDGWMIFHDYIVNDWGVGVIKALMSGWITIPPGTRMFSAPETVPFGCISSVGNPSPCRRHSLSVTIR